MHWRIMLQRNCVVSRPAGSRPCLRLCSVNPNLGQVVNGRHWHMLLVASISKCPLHSPVSRETWHCRINATVCRNQRHVGESSADLMLQLSDFVPRNKTAKWCCTNLGSDIVVEMNQQGSNQKLTSFIGAGTDNKTKNWKFYSGSV